MLHLLLSIIMAVAPALVLIAFIIVKDKRQPEPPRELFKAFMMGVLSLIIALVLVSLISLFITCDESTVLGQIGQAFFMAAIPEECAKLLVLWLCLRSNKYFNEHVDGIVYAVMVGMGFAMTENLLYMVSDYDTWLSSTGVVRALLPVPMHYVDAVFMGYFYSLAAFSATKSKYYYAMSLGVPIVIHGVYDAFLMVGTVIPENFYVLIFFVLLYLCFLMHKEALRRIKQHLQSDLIIMPHDTPHSETRQSSDVEYIEYEEVKTENKEQK